MTITPMKDDKSAVVALCQQLSDATRLKRNGKSIKFTNLASNTDIPIDSWKFLEWDYGKDNIQLPIQARGLFTTNNDTIVVRGYDKFFNVEEKPFTKEEEILKSTKGPYDVTLKENGCIIFISGLHTGDIIVCSKHSTGDRDEGSRNHAREGEMHLLKQLGEARVRELAKYLYDNNLTVVAELCDDEFEEHVLPYPKDKSGLYVHGLNYNTILFNTVPIQEVIDFSKEWGFRYVQFLTYTSGKELFTFLHKCSETGTYNGKEVEGFVIRCHRSDGLDFFFKYKFEQPYLLYRQFRECTRELISGKTIAGIRIKKNREITKKYLEFVQDLFAKEPSLKEDFENGHGIIKIRQLFLQNLNETNGMNLLSIDEQLAQQLSSVKLDPVYKYILVPIATIGCGKTTVFNTLASLFPEWVHIQNDNISKNAKLKIVDLTLKALDQAPVVLFDRNNSAARERKQIFTTVDQKRHEYIDDIVEVRYVAINFIDENVSDKDLWDITFGRIEKRGDNHQSIKPETDRKLVEGIMKGFIGRLQPVNTEAPPDSAFDFVINLKLTRSENSSLDNVKNIIKELGKKYPELIQTRPTDNVIEQKFKEALEYTPTFIKDMTSKKPKNPTYYGISINYARVMDEITPVLESNDNYNKLKHENLVQDEFHVTLGHVASTKEKANRGKWKDMKSKLGLGNPNETKSVLPFFGDIKLLQVVVNRGKLICIKVELIKIYKKSKEIVEVEPLNKHTHITIGCFPPTQAYESNNALEELYQNDEELKPDGEYKCGDDTLDVINFTSEITLPNQKVFVVYQ
ncbi:tRNA ligase [Candida viswanathii]|uniref:tRNA ligase n=1 Tax=Candida viswanathii TaxID=5486 RepID=A0A367YJG9_9ASCO|nr:tRNA ligase [Candida viswanathii]